MLIYAPAKKESKIKFTIGELFFIPPVAATAFAASAGALKDELIISNLFIFPTYQKYNTYEPIISTVH